MNCQLWSLIFTNETSLFIVRSLFHYVWFCLVLLSLGSFFAHVILQTCAIIMYNKHLLTYLNVTENVVWMVVTPVYCQGQDRVRRTKFFSSLTKLYTGGFVMGRAWHLTHPSPNFYWVKKCEIFTSISDPSQISESPRFRNWEILFGI